MHEEDSPDIAGFESDLRRTSEELTIHEADVDFGALVYRKIDRYWRERQLFEEVAQSATSQATVGEAEAARFAEDLRRTRQELRIEGTVDLGQVVSRATSKYWESRRAQVAAEDERIESPMIPAAVAMFENALTSFDDEATELATDALAISTPYAYRNWFVTWAGLLLALVTFAAIYVKVNGIPAIATLGAPLHAMNHDRSYGLLSITLLLVLGSATVILFGLPTVRQWMPVMLGVVTAGVLAIIYLAAYDDVAKDFALARQQLDGVAFNYLTQGRPQNLVIPQTYVIKNCDSPTSSAVRQLCARPDGMRGELTATLSMDQADMAWHVDGADLLKMRLLSGTVDRIEGDHLVLRIGKDTDNIPLTDKARALTPGQRIVLQRVEGRPDVLLLPDSPVTLLR